MYKTLEEILKYALENYPDTVTDAICEYHPIGKGVDMFLDAIEYKLIVRYHDLSEKIRESNLEGIEWMHWENEQSDIGCIRKKIEECRKNKKVFD